MPKLRAGSEAAGSLLASDNPQEWDDAFDSYEESVERLSQEKGRLGLVEADRWWRTDLPAALCARGAEPYLTKEELVKAVQWKLWMGVVRPNLLRFANETNPEKVKAKSREAFQHLPSPPIRSSAAGKKSAAPETVARVSTVALKKAVTALTSELKGVGPATASAILAAYCGGCPFDADEVIDAVMGTGVRKYSLPEYLKVQETLDGKAMRLGKRWDAERVRRALWSRAMHSRFNLEMREARLVPESATGASDEGSNEGVGNGGGEAKGARGKQKSGAEGRAKRHKSRR